MVFSWGFRLTWTLELRTFIYLRSGAQCGSVSVWDVFTSISVWTEPWICTLPPLFTFILRPIKTIIIRKLQGALIVANTWGLSRPSESRIDIQKTVKGGLGRDLKTVASKYPDSPLCVVCGVSNRSLSRKPMCFVNKPLVTVAAPPLLSLSWPGAVFKQLCDTVSACGIRRSRTGCVARGAGWEVLFCLSLRSIFDW